MSYNNPGQYGGYTPPPPMGAPRRGMSPWAWVGIGCGGLALLGFGGCVAIGIIGANAVKKEMARPISEASVKQGLGDVPVYPDAQLDVNTTHGMNIALPLIRKEFNATDEGTMAAFRTSDSLDKVESWYEKKLTALGFKPTNLQPQYTCFQRKTEVVGIQQDNNAKTEAGSTMFTLIYFKNTQPK